MILILECRFRVFKEQFCNITKCITDLVLKLSCIHQNYLDKKYLRLGGLKIIWNLKLKVHLILFFLPLSLSQGTSSLIWTSGFMSVLFSDFGEDTSDTCLTSAEHRMFGEHGSMSEPEWSPEKWPGSDFESDFVSIIKWDWFNWFQLTIHRPKN